MNDRFFIHQVTVYHTDNDEDFTKMIFKNVYFRHNKKINLVDKGFQKGSTGSITIPTTEKLDISNDDYVIEGIVGSVADINKMKVKDLNIMQVRMLSKEGAKFDLNTMKSNYQVFKVVSVDDNRKGGLPHYKIGVSE